MMEGLTPPDALVLRAGALEAALWPSLGGRVATFRTLGGPEWLEPIPRDLPLAEALRSGGAYPMAPYCGRIEQGRFDFDDERHPLPPHPISAPHSLHGIAWDAPFAGELISPSAAKMTLDHPGGGGWPWAFRLEQRVTLNPEGLAIAMRLTNTDARRQAVGLGFHPFFPREGARLTFRAARRWRLGPTLVPVANEPIPERMDFSRGARVSPGFDDVFGGFDGRGWIDWPWGALEMTAGANTATAVLFSPPARRFFCFEPISHAPNAHNREGLPDLRVLEPGEGHSVEMRLTPTLPAR